MKLAPSNGMFQLDREQQEGGDCVPAQCQPVFVRDNKHILSKLKQEIEREIAPTDAKDKQWTNRSVLSPYRPPR